MSRSGQSLVRPQNKVGIIALTWDNHATSLVGLATLGGAVVAFLFYFFSLFFGGIEWRALNDF